jgi:hypothetical protein
MSPYPLFDSDRYRIPQDFPVRINLSCWIRIQEGKNDPQKLKKVIEVPDVLFGGLKASPFAWASFMEA